MRWLRRFFYSDDPVVKLVGALTEPEAEMWREILESNGIVAMVKNMSALAYQWGRATLPLGNNFDLFVRQSDLERAREVLAAVPEQRQGEFADEEHGQEGPDDPLMA